MSSYGDACEAPKWRFQVGSWIWGGIQKKAIIYLTNLLFLDMFYFPQVFPVMLSVTVIGCVSSLMHTCLCIVFYWFVRIYFHTCDFVTVIFHVFQLQCLVTLHPHPTHREVHSRGQVLEKWTGRFRIGLFEFSLPVLLPFGERKCKGRGCRSLGVRYSIRTWPFGASAMMFTKQSSLGVCSVFTRGWPRRLLPALGGMWEWSVSRSHLGEREVLS